MGGGESAGGSGSPDADLSPCLLVTARTFLLSLQEGEGGLFFRALDKQMRSALEGMIHGRKAVSKPGTQAIRVRVTLALSVCGSN